MASIEFSVEDGIRKKEEEEEGGRGEGGGARTDGWPATFHTPPLSSTTSSGAATPRSWQGSPGASFGSSSSRSSNSCLPDSWFGVFGWLGFGFESKRRGAKRKSVKVWYRKRLKGVVVVIGLLSCFLVMNWWMLSRIQNSSQGLKYKLLRANSSTLAIREELEKLGKVKRPQKTVYARLLAKAAHALAEGQNKPDPRDLWVEPFVPASSWIPCADQRSWEPSEGNNGYILVSANGGINQQRVAVCNAVAVARLLNATLVVPKFLYSSVWRDTRRTFLSTT